jgi:hypothetical protein
MNISERVLILSTMILTATLFVACGVADPMPTFTATATTAPSFTPSTPLITPSPIPTVTLLPTNILIASPEPDIAPNCKIVNEEGQYYLLSDREIP